MSTDAAQLLAVGGLVADRLPRYELRPQQLEMVREVADAFERGAHLLIEAGTGVGKSFAYLLPAIQRVTEHSQRVVISTHTIALQEQLFHKDVPFLQSVLPDKFSAVLVKGRSNYLSLRRLEMASRRGRMLFDTDAEHAQLGAIAEWAYETEDGSLADLPFWPASGVWEQVRSDPHNCMGRRCPQFQKCFYHQARRRAAAAGLLIVNHAMFFSDLALRAGGAAILPDYDAVVLDEAHMIEPVAGDHFGVDLADSQLEHLLNSLYNDRTRKGALASLGANDVIRQVDTARMTINHFFAELVGWQDHHGRRNGRLLEPLQLRNTVSPALRGLREGVRQAIQRLNEEDERRYELNALAERLAAHSDALVTLLDQQVDGWVYWLEQTGRRKRIVRLVGRPVDVSGALRESLFDQDKSVVMTGATLSTGRAAAFDYIRERLGLDEGVRTCALGSPFNYAEQVELHLVPDMPAPSEAAAFGPAVSAAIRKYITRSDGRAFVLFTSYVQMFACADELEMFFAEERIELLVQGRGLTRSAMLERFREDIRSVIFGTDSFWAGVDVPGEALSNVIIVKLPFEAPDKPPVEARIEQLRAAGKSPFMEYQLPEAILKLRQGFGRLIRTMTDRGIVVILDPRVRTKPYGRAFLGALPECRVIDDEPLFDSQ